MRRLGTVVPLVALLVAGALAAGCGVPAGGGPKAIPKDQVPFHLLAPETPTTTTTAPTAVRAPVTVYFVTSAQEYVVPVQRSVLPTANPDASLRSVLDALLDGPTATEVAAGVETAFSSGVQLISADVTGGVTTKLATVNFNQAFGQISGSLQVLAVAQVVFTVTGQLGPTAGVQFEIHGFPIEVPIAGGAQVPGPVHLTKYATRAPPTTTTTTG